MKALVLHELHQPLTYEEVENPQPQAGQVLVNIKAAALNHRDNWITKGLYPNSKGPAILGSDGAGETADGRAVIINPNINWGDNPRLPSSEYVIMGLEYPGTFAEQVAVDADRLVDKPEHLTFEQAAAFPLAGLTGYRALVTNCQVTSNDKVLISGIGGGVALAAFQFAVAIGAEVYVTSSSEEKIQKAVEMGAAGGANYREEKWSKAFGKETGGFDVIIDSAGGPDFANLVRLTRPGARIGFFGGTRGNWEKVSPPTLFFNQVSIFGSTMGNDQEFSDMVALVNEHKIVPVVDSVFPLADGNKALAHMDQGLQFGKIILAG